MARNYNRSTYDNKIENHNSTGRLSRTLLEHCESANVSLKLRKIVSRVLQWLRDLSNVNVSASCRIVAEDLVDEAKLAAGEDAIAAASVNAENIAAALGDKFWDPMSERDPIGINRSTDCCRVGTCAAQTSQFIGSRFEQSLALKRIREV